VAGNQGGLNESGVEKLTDVYRQQLNEIQILKRQAADRASGEQ
jgi:ribosomal protein L19